MNEFQAKSFRIFTIHMDHENYLYKKPSTIPGRSRENRSHTFHKPAKLYWNFSVIYNMKIDTSKKKTYNKTPKQQLSIDFVKFHFQYIDWLNLSIALLDGRKKNDNTTWIRSWINNILKKYTTQPNPRKVTVTQCMEALYLCLST